MDILTRLDSQANYTTTQLQLILGAWVLATPFERKAKISLHDGDVAEDDYDKRSIYSLLYSLYRSMGVVRSESGQPYEFTFNTWGYAWPAGWGEAPSGGTDPQRFGKNAYTGLFEFAQVKDRLRERDGEVHVVEMGCGTGAGAHHICGKVLPRCTYEAIDMQRAAIQTCRRKFVPELDGRLVAICTDATRTTIRDEAADFVVICETHVAEMTGQVTDEDRLFFRTAHRLLKPGGFLVWGNAIPSLTWPLCFDFLKSIGMELCEVKDVTPEAVAARDADEGRVEAYVSQCLDRFFGFRIPFLGNKKRAQAGQAMKNFYRNPGTSLYTNMKDGTDAYKVALLRKAS